MRERAGVRMHTLCVPLLVVVAQVGAIAATGCYTSEPLITPNQNHSRPSIENADRILALLFIHLVGFIQTDRGWFAELSDSRLNEIVIRKEHDVAFCFHIKQLLVDDNAVVLEVAGREHRLAMGQITSDLFPNPNLISREWVSQWRDALAALPTVDQEVARNAVRSYWKEQWGKGLAEQVSRMPIDQQATFRAELSRLWQQ
jgi:hypothetical protein